MIDSATLAHRLHRLDVSRLVVRRTSDPVGRLTAVAEAVGCAAPRLVPLLGDLPELRSWVIYGEVRA